MRDRVVWTMADHESTPRGPGEGTVEGVRRRDGGAAERRIAADAFKAFWPDCMGVAMRRSCRAAAAISCVFARGRAVGLGRAPRRSWPWLVPRRGGTPWRRPPGALRIGRRCAEPPVRRAACGAPRGRSPRPLQGMAAWSVAAPPAAAADAMAGRRGHVTAWPACSGPPPTLCGPRYVAAGRGAARVEGRHRAPAAGICLRPVAGGRLVALVPAPPSHFSRFWAAASAPTRGPHPLNRPPSSRPASRTVLGAAPGMARDNAAAVRIVPSSCLYGGPEAPV